MGLHVTLDSKLVAAGSDDNCCHLWNMDTDEVHALTGHENTVQAVCMSPDGKVLVTGCSAGTLMIWDLVNRECIFLQDDVHDLGITCMDFNPKGQEILELVTGGNDTKLKVWKIEDKCKIKFSFGMEGHSSSIMSASYSMNGEVLVSTSVDKTVKLWETDTFRCTATLGPFSRYISCGAFSNDSKILAASFDKYINLWNLDFRAEFNLETIPATNWSCRQVQAFLTKQGLDQYLKIFTDVNGQILVKLSSQNMKDMGVTEKDTIKLLQSIQWARFGSKNAAHFDDETPDEFLCPITCDLMINPVKCEDGFVYEESAIKEWLMTRRNTSPMTNLEIANNLLVPCSELKLRIEEFRKSR